MALAYRTLYKNCYYLQNITKPLKWSVENKYPMKILASGICYQNTFTKTRPLFEARGISFVTKNFRQCSSQSSPPPDKPLQEPVGTKKGIIKKFKAMYRDYWYVLLPVHVCTSAVWFGSFYYAVRSGVDIFGLLQSLGISDSLIAPLKDSTAGYFALALALYKLATPLRYAVTVGGTTVAIRKLTAIGFIKPVPSRERIKEIFQEKRDNLQDRFKESKQHYQVQMKEKRTQVMEDLKRYKTDMRNIKNKVKKIK
ncbi:uncharacterized protein C18orf19 homolog A isoform X2 [Trichoplusia ni]|uniref:Uncharacterized protein C18orf19 homolog A isoform X2 n=1 Tax=Trichoplusia ni TaxID=7111 RepID=A0A7E5VFA8_TRINI|nr:uncharacterized protein C18orf19 homolog A isoform X2 [Trichoplusia ni]